MYDLLRFIVIFYGLKKSYIKEFYFMISVVIMNVMMDVGILLEVMGVYMER